MSEAFPLAPDHAMPKDFDCEEYFRNYFGIIADGDPEIIKLKVIPLEAKYMRSLPLHHSQKEIATTDEYSIFQLYLSPTSKWAKLAKSLNCPHLDILKHSFSTVESV